MSIDKGFAKEKKRHFHFCGLLVCIWIHLFNQGIITFGTGDEWWWSVNIEKSGKKLDEGKKWMEQLKDVCTQVSKRDSVEEYTLQICRSRSAFEKMKKSATATVTRVQKNHADNRWDLCTANQFNALNYTYLSFMLVSCACFSRLSAAVLNNSLSLIQVVLNSTKPLMPLKMFYCGLESNRV